MRHLELDDLNLFRHIAEAGSITAGAARANLALAAASTRVKGMETRLGVVLFTLLLFSGLGSTTVGAQVPRPGTVIGRLVALLAVLVAMGLLTSVVTAWGRTQATDVRIVASVLLLAPPAFFIGMMFTLGLSIWRRQARLLPFFWCANGITSMFASVLGMALSIQFGIAATYAIGICFYVVCAIALATSRRAASEREPGITTPESALMVPAGTASSGIRSAKPATQPA